jgi:hypothetical protein
MIDVRGTFHSPVGEIPLLWVDVMLLFTLLLLLGSRLLLLL